MSRSLLTRKKLSFLPKKSADFLNATPHRDALGLNFLCPFRYIKYKTDQKQ